MKHIKAYMNKIDAMLASTKPSSPKKKSFGFASSKEKPAEETKREDMNMKIIADVVQGIREAREELVNAKS
jgi:ribosome-binding protein aMBF1 (putative translation factor)